MRNLPASIFERSSTSLIRTNNCLPEFFAFFRYSPLLCGLSKANSIMPKRPFIGVRNSWLILARNSDFALFASTACCSASSAFCMASLRDESASRTLFSIGRKINKASQSNRIKVKIHKNISTFSTRSTLLVAASSNACTALSRFFSKASLFCALNREGGAVQVLPDAKNALASAT